MTANKTFFFDGQEILIRPGDTYASALTRAGILALRRSPNGQPRGLFCGIGLCQECRVVLDEDVSLRACMSVARPGTQVRPAR